MVVYMWRLCVVWCGVVVSGVVVCVCWCVVEWCVCVVVVGMCVCVCGGGIVGMCVWCGGVCGGGSW